MQLESRDLWQFRVRFITDSSNRGQLHLYCTVLCASSLKYQKQKVHLHYICSDRNKRLGIIGINKQWKPSHRCRWEEMLNRYFYLWICNRLSTFAWSSEQWSSLNEKLKWQFTRLKRSAKNWLNWVETYHRQNNNSKGFLFLHLNLTMM
jgi:hypothetical protein